LCHVFVSAVNSNVGRDQMCSVYSPSATAKQIPELRWEDSKKMNDQRTFGERSCPINRDRPMIV